MKSLIIIPSIFEAEQIETKSKYQEYNEISDKLLFAISGIAKTGLKITAEIVQKKEIKAIILLGMCGDLTNENRTGNAYIINKVTNKKSDLNIDNNSIGFFQNIFGRSDLVTVNKGVFTKTRKTNLYRYAKLVDMETFYYALLSKELNVDFNAIRVISDDCTSDIKEHFKGSKQNTTELKNLKKAQTVIKDIFNSIVKHLS
jgi:nucleoside phosphorylase